MTFLDAVVDTLVPGDDVLPPGSTAGVRLDAESHRAALDGIARAAGGADAFLAADAARRIVAIREVERAAPDAFAALLCAVVEEYYDSDPVIEALGWTPEPPQPNGHPLPAFDEGLLAKVKGRGAMWRDPRG